MNTDTQTQMKTNLNTMNVGTVETERKSMQVSIKQPNDQELSIVQGIHDSINVNDTTSVIKFGVEAQSSITNFADGVLDTVKTKDLSGAGDNLQKMIDEMQTIDFSSIKASDGLLSNIPVIGNWLKKTSRNFIGDFESVSEKVGTMLTTLNGQETVLLKDVTMLDNLYGENLSLVRNLELFILAGEQKISELQQEVSQLENIAKETNDALDVQKASDLSKSLNRFEKRVNNLKIARVAAIQAGTQIRMVQESDKILVEDINDIINNTVPMWKRQFVMAITLSRQEKALKISKTVKDYTNKQYVDNATKLNELVTQVNDSYNRGILDIDTMQEVNKATIGAIQTTLSKQKEARVKRQEAEKQLIVMENDLKNALLDASNKGGL